LASIPNTDEQSLAVYNYTGVDNCVFFSVCTAVNITDWTLTVQYTAGTVPGTITYGPNGTDAIGPSVGFAPYTGPVSGPWAIDQLDTVITSATFSGRISSGNDPVPLTLSDTSTFFAAPTFSVTYAPVNLADPSAPYYSTADILVNDSVTGGPAPGGGAPEPSSISLFLVGAGAVGVSRVKRRRKVAISHT
jgi:hypothetical protein